MRTVRSNCFETNSSSTHSIAIDTTCNTPARNVRGTIVDTNDFGWEFRKFNDFETKCSYFLTLLQYGREDVLALLYKNLVALSRKHGFLLVDPDHERGHYVDHGTEHFLTWVEKNPQLNTLEGLEEFLMTDSGWIMLGNDNDGDPPGFRMVPSEFESSPFYVMVDQPNAEAYPLNIIADLQEVCSDIVNHINTTGSGYPTFKSVTDKLIKYKIVSYAWESDGTRKSEQHKSVKYKILTNEEYKAQKNEIATQVPKR